MTKISKVDNRFPEVDRRYKTLQTARGIVMTADKAVTLGVGALMAKSVVKNESSVITKYITKGVDFLAGAAKQGLAKVDKKGITKNITGVLNKVIAAPAKTKSLAVIGAAVAIDLLSNIQKNNQIKGMMEQAKNDTKVVEGLKQDIAETVLPRAIREAQKDTREKIAFGA